MSRPCFKLGLAFEPPIAVKYWPVVRLTFEFSLLNFGDKMLDPSCTCIHPTFTGRAIADLAKLGAAAFLSAVGRW